MGNPDPELIVPENRELYYQCQRCTACCRWPGFVHVGPEEIDRIAAFLGLEPKEFIERYTRLGANRKGLSLTEKANHECVFLEGNDCAIQPAKPEQCAEFPNGWNFPGWRKVCHALPVLRKKEV